MKHDVYLSFRAKDTRWNFISHLCGCLRKKGIKVYLYDEVASDNIYEESFKAIEESRISVIVFSVNFADSKWCLEEVVAIMKRKEMFGQVVIPVLYNVDPFDIENLTGSFGDGFAKRRENATKRQEWKDGFTEAIKLPGWSNNDIKLPGWANTAVFRDEEKLVNEIAVEIKNKLLRVSRTKVIIERSLVITNLLLEIPSSVLDQMSSTNKPKYALAAMSISLLACLLSIVDLIHKGRVERVVWKWKWKPIPWFYYPTKRSNIFGSFPDMVGLLCSLCQTILTVINFSFITRGVDPPIKFLAWPFIFALALLFTMFLKKI